VKVENNYIEMNLLMDSFNDMIFRLERSFKHIEQFSSHMAHEIKTPLTIMKGESELVLMQERQTREYERVLRVNLDEIEKMLQIVEDLLLLSRMDYQPECFHLGEIHLVPYLEEIHEQLKILTKDKEVQVLFDLPQEQNIVIRGDVLHLRRLFFNLIDNALKFTPAPGEVRVKLEKHQTMAAVSIQDTGIGIKEDDLQKIFDRFYRVESAYPGSGLGLSIVSAIVKAHNGTINVQSRMREGTTFIVELPLI
jgi:signal transduction histidine kinase